MKRLIYVLVLALMLGIGAWSPAGAGQFAEQYVAPQAVQAASTYWTPARMAAAKPVSMGVAKDPGAIGVADVAPPGPPGAVRGGPGGPPSALLSGDGFDALAYTEAFAGEPVGVTGFAYPPPHNTFRLPDWLYGTTSTQFPYRTVGKVFFTKFGGGNFVCSGSSIGGRAVLTAGHCVSDGAGHFHTNETFVPAYRNGLRPFDTWTAFYKVTFNAWHTGQDLGRDVGMFAVSDKVISGVPTKLSARVGWLGFAWNFTRIQCWNMFGYPAAAPWTGAFMVTTQACYSRSDIVRNPDTQGIGTTQTGGCSGGPWIKNFMNGDFANGVNSYVYTANPLEIFSPYFDTAVNNMRVATIAK